jgi:hypothetical protein
MARDFFDPTPEQQNVILVDAANLREAEQLIECCEYCNPTGAEIPFDWILDRVTGSDSSVTDTFSSSLRNARSAVERSARRRSLSLHRRGWLL